VALSTRMTDLGRLLAIWFRHMVPIRRPSKFARLGAWRAVMLKASQGPRNAIGGLGRPSYGHHMSEPDR
jgi:hypothetical protein